MKLLNGKTLMIITLIIISLGTLTYLYKQHNKLVDVTDFTKGKFEKDYWKAVKKVDYRVSDLVIIAKTSGCIQLHFNITEQGLISDPKVIKEVNGIIFEEPLLESLKHWRFEPSQANKQARTPIRSMRFFSIGSDNTVHTRCLPTPPSHKNKT